MNVTKDGWRRIQTCWKINEKILKDKVFSLSQNENSVIYSQSSSSKPQINVFGRMFDTEICGAPLINAFKYCTYNKPTNKDRHTLMFKSVGSINWNLFEIIK